MKKKSFSIFIVFVTFLMLCFTGCTKNITVNNGTSPLVPDGFNFEMNYEGDVNVNVVEPNNQQTITTEETDVQEDDNETVEEEAEDEEDEEDVSAEDEDVSDNNDAEEENPDEIAPETSDELTVSEDGEYTSKDEVALYIHLYNHLPSNYITKNEAKELGWDSSQGNLNKVAPGKSIGGDKFGNREGLLPKASGRVYYECDIDYKKGSRNAKRIVYSNDGLIYYTEDHYESYELLYE